MIRSVLLLLLLVPGSSLLFSCSSSVTILNGKIEKQIEPSVPAPSSPSSAFLKALPNGDLLYFSIRREGIVAIQYTDSFVVRRQDTIRLHEDLAEDVDWNALNIDGDAVSIFTTLFPDDDEDTDSTRYLVRTFSLTNGSVSAPKHLYAFPAGAKDALVVKCDLANRPYGGYGTRSTIMSYQSPDNNTFIISESTYHADSMDYTLTFSIFSSANQLVKKGSLQIRKDTVTERPLGAFPGADNDVIFGTFVPERRTLRLTQYKLTDGSTSELTYTFENLDNFNAYAFSFIPPTSAGRPFYIAGLVNEPPSFWHYKYSIFGGLELGAVDFPKKQIHFKRYLPKESALEEMVDRDELRNLRVKNVFVEEKHNRIVAVLEELDNYSEGTSSHRTIITGFDDAGRQASITNPGTVTTSGSIAVSEANNIWLAGFDMDLNPVWEQGFENEIASRWSIHVGSKSTISGSALSLWYPSDDDVLFYHKFDYITGKRLGDPAKTEIMEFGGAMDMLAPFSLTDTNDNLVFLTQGGADIGGDYSSYLLRVSLPK